MRIVLFFTENISLRAWQSSGMLQREIALYKKYVEMGHHVDFITYGGAEDLEYGRDLDGIGIHCNKKGMPPDTYKTHLAEIHTDILKRADIIKTNQTRGAQFAHEAAIMHGKPLVARCGYMLSEFDTLDHGPDSPQARHSFDIEARVFGAADAVVVTTQTMRQSLLDRALNTPDKVHVVPNYVDPSFFSLKRQHTQFDLCFVGRLVPQKNLDALLQAVEAGGWSLQLIGSGEDEERLRTKFSHMDHRIVWIPAVPHEMLPSVMNKARLFVLPSHFEGHPKVLIEAMFLGMPVLGTSSPGILEIVKHGENGFLCGTDAASIQAGIEQAFAKPEIMDLVAANAKLYSRQHYTLAAIAEQEIEILNKCIRNWSCK